MFRADQVEKLYKLVRGTPFVLEKLVCSLLDQFLHTHNLTQQTNSF